MVRAAAAAGPGAVWLPGNFHRHAAGQPRRPWGGHKGRETSRLGPWVAVVPAGKSHAPSATLRVPSRVSQTACVSGPPPPRRRGRHPHCRRTQHRRHQVTAVTVVAACRPPPPPKDATPRRAAPHLAGTTDASHKQTLTSVFNNRARIMPVKTKYK